MHIYYSYAKLSKNSRAENLSKLVSEQLELTDNLISYGYKKLPTKIKQIFIHKKNLIDKADLVIVEATYPSTDLGGEIVYALTINKPVLALIYGENNDKITPMLIGNPSSKLFLEHYDSKSLTYILKNFLKHVTFMLKNKGKLVVIDGGDGSLPQLQGMQGRMPQQCRYGEAEGRGDASDAPAKGHSVAFQAVRGFFRGGKACRRSASASCERHDAAYRGASACRASSWY